MKRDPSSPAFPFPYFFGLSVTRDPVAIRQAVEKKFDEMKVWENHTIRASEFKACVANILLVAKPDPADPKPGKYVADPDKVKAIVEKCLAKITPLLLDKVSPHANTIHPDQIDQSVETSEKSFDVDPSVSRPHFMQVLKDKGVRIVEEKPPPPSPQGIRAVADAPGRVYVSWQAVAGHGAVKYELSRQIGTGPAKVLRILEKASCEDGSVAPGTTYRYSVRTVADDGKSDPPAESAPVLAYGEVNDFHATPHPGRVELTWVPPPKAARIEVRKKLTDAPLPLGTPDPAAELVPLPGNQTAFTDTRVTNGQVYAYRVSAVYAATDGTEVVTLGLVDKAVPREPPPLVRDLAIASNATGVTVTWANPQRARVRVIRAATAPALSVGQLQPASALAGLGTSLARADLDRAADPSPDATTGVYAVFAEDGHSATYCGAVQLVELLGWHVRGGDDLRVEWAWPDGCVGVTVARDGLTAEVRDVPRPPNQSRGACHFAAKDVAVGDHRVTIRCRTDPTDRASAAGPGVTDTARVSRLARLAWKFERDRKKPTQVVVFGLSGAHGVRKLTLVGRVGMQPETVSDGHFIEEWVPAPDAAGVDRRPAPDWKSRDGAVICRLFADPPASATVAHPHADGGTL